MGEHELDGTTPSALIAIAKAAHTAGDRALERAAKKLLRERHGMTIAFCRGEDSQKKSTAAGEGGADA